jgi:hypothetical protein
MLKLDTELNKYIETLMDRSNEEYDKGEYAESIRLLEDAWDKLPEPKGEYSESFHIARYISETYMLINNLKQTKKWSNELFKCGLHRIDSGERELLAGKVAFELGEFEISKKYFTIANDKSEGRCFEDEDIKYVKFFKKR